MKSSIELLREFYYASEWKAQNDEMLGAINSAYVQIENDLKQLEEVKIVYRKWLNNTITDIEFCRLMFRALEEKKDD